MTRLTTRRSLLLAAPLLTLALVRPASAHAHLHSAAPAPDASVAATPHEVRIDFTEEVEPRFSGIAVTDAAGRRVDQGQPHTAKGDAKRLIVGLGPLKPGHYRVAWHALSTDGHKTHGEYGFSVK